MTRKPEGYAGKSLVGTAEVAALITLLPDGGRMLEIGTYHGVTAAEVASAHPTSVVHCVDTFVSGPGSNDVEGDEEKWRKNAKPNMRLFVGDARGFAAQSDALFDLVFVDGAHTYENCLEDLRVCAGLVRPGGLLLAHDYGRAPGVVKAVDEFLADSVWRLFERVWKTAVMKRERDG